jgi:hypothetical protein
MMEYNYLMYINMELNKSIYSKNIKKTFKERLFYKFQNQPKRYLH